MDRGGLRVMASCAAGFPMLPVLAAGDGDAPVMAYLVPGDLSDIHVFLLRRMDHSIGLLSDAVVGLIWSLTAPLERIAE